MEFRISQHAATEMCRRGIGREVVLDILDNPQQIVAGRVGRKVYQSQLIFGDDKMPPVVVTVYRTSKVTIEHYMIG